MSALTFVTASRHFSKIRLQYNRHRGTLDCFRACYTTSFQLGASIEKKPFWACNVYRKEAAVHAKLYWYNITKYTLRKTYSSCSRSTFHSCYRHFRSFSFACLQCIKQPHESRLMQERLNPIHYFWMLRNDSECHTGPKIVSFPPLRRCMTFASFSFTFFFHFITE